MLLSSLARAASAPAHHSVCVTRLRAFHVILPPSKHGHIYRCKFSTSVACGKQQDQLPPRPTVAESDTAKRSLKGSGPGGQKINKTNSAIQLRHLPTGIVVKCQATRSRTQNEKIARRILAEKVEELQKGDQSRARLKEERKSKKKRSAEKKKRRKYRKLADEGNQSGEEELEGRGEDNGEEQTEEDREHVVTEYEELPADVEILVEEVEGEDRENENQTERDRR